MLEVAAAAEASGFDSFFLMDHVQQIGGVGRPEDPMLEPYTLLGAVAARTSRLTLGTLVTSVVYRNPALLAKMVTTLDIISERAGDPGDRGWLVRGRGDALRLQLAGSG